MFSRGHSGLLGKKKKSGPGLGFWLVVGGLVGVTGVGTYVADSVKGLRQPCYEATSKIRAGRALCDIFEDGMTRASSAMDMDLSQFGSIGDLRLPDNMRQFTRQIDGLIETEGFQAAIGPELSRYIDVDALRRINLQTGGMGDQILSDAQKMSMALSQTALGNGMLSGQFGDRASPVEAAAWYEKGASMGEFGILSQLSLGNMYVQGDKIAPDFGRAEAYYAETLRSLNTLEAADTPEAQALLRSLPADPEQLRASLEAQLQHLNR